MNQRRRTRGVALINVRTRGKHDGNERIVTSHRCSRKSTAAAMIFLRLPFGVCHFERLEEQYRTLSCLYLSKLFRSSYLIELAHRLTLRVERHHHLLRLAHSC